MRDTSEIETRVRELLLAELQRRLHRQKLPAACVHNRRHPLDHRKAVYGEPNGSYNRISQGTEEVGGRHVSLPVVQTIGLCMLGAESIDSWPGNICEEPLDAKRCPDFAYRETRAQLYEAFVAELSNPAWVEESLPAVHSLLWVLGRPLATARAKGVVRFWRWLSRPFSRAARNSADVLVYLPALDACPDQDRVGAAAPN